MGTDIHGHVEIIQYQWDTRWTKVLDIGPLLERNYTLFGFFFGVRTYSTTAVAKNRGIPEDADRSLFLYEKETRKYVHRPDPGDDCTWIGYNEIEEVLKKGLTPPDDWQVVFDIMKLLNRHATPEEDAFEEEEEHFRAIQRPCYCRLVVWFDS